MQNLILKQALDESDLNQLAEKLSLIPRSAPAPEGMFRRLFFTPDEESAVDYIGDSITGVCYFSVRGARVKALSKKLLAEVPIWKRDELLKHTLLLLVQGTPEQRQLAAFQVAAEMVEYDAASAGVLTAFLHLDEPETRRAGIRAFRARPWPEFRGTAAELSADADPEVAEVARQWLARIEELHGAV